MRAHDPVGFPPRSWVFNDRARQPLSNRKRGPSRAGFGWSPTPTSPPGMAPADPAAAAAVMLRDESRTMDNATQSGPRPEREAHTRQVVSSATSPERLAAQRPCGSTTDKLGTAVNVWRRGCVATATANPACSTRCVGARHHSARHPKSLLSSPDSGDCDTR